MPEWWNGRRSGLKIRGPVIGRTGSSPVSGTRTEPTEPDLTRLQYEKGFAIL